MAASAADVRSALSIPDSSATAGPSQLKKPATATARKPEGISRELYSLIGPSQPSLAAQLAKPRLKQKPKFGGTGTSVTKWELRAFANPGRKDAVELRHWVKATEDPASEYPFAKYNIQNPSYNYSQDEYARFLEDKDWTKELTDYLFQMYQEYDGRWHIIWDRIELPPGKFQLDDLKDRYYSVCRKLVRSRPWAGDETSKAVLLSSLQFDKERELTRKKYLTSLENRTPEQIAEEEALYVEIRKLEQNERRFKRDREELLRTIAGMDSGLPDLVEDDGGPLGLTADTKSLSKRKKGGTAMDIDSPATPSVTSTIIASVKRPQTAKNVAYDAQQCIIRTDLSPNTPATKAAHQPAYLRSSKLPVLKANSIAPKIAQAFSELNLSPSRLVMPTRENCAQLDALFDAVCHLIETKRVVDKVEFDSQVLRNQLGMRNSQPMEGEGAGEDVEDNETEGDPEGDEGIKSEYAMDVEEIHDAGEAEMDGNEDRGQSVVSTRSTRSRRKTRRSMSVSSVDTTTTNVSTRANTKRQKRS